MGRFENILLDLEDILKKCERSKFNKSKLMYNEHDVDDMLDIVSELLTNMPSEIEEAKTVLERKDEIIRNAKVDAKEIIADGEREVSNLVSEHEVYIEAVKKAEELENETKEKAEQYIFDMFSFLDDKLEETDSKLQEFNLKIESQIQENREIFQKIYDYQEAQLESSKDCLNTIQGNISQVRSDIRQNQ